MVDDSAINYNKHDLEDHYGVSAVIYDDENRVLVLDHVKLDFWTIPVGKANLDEMPEEQVKREVFEECNIHILSLNKLAEKTIEYVRRGKKVNVITIVYEVSHWEGKAINKEPDKHRELRFVSVDELKNMGNLSDSTKMFLECVEQREGC